MKRLFAFGAATTALAALFAFVPSCSSDDASGAPGGGAEAGASDDSPVTCNADLTNDIKNCGACGHVCPSYASGAPTCVVGKCVDPGCDDPDAALGDCNGDPNDGCETRVGANDAKNCGACAHDCLGTSGCTSGMCAPAVLATSQKEPFGVVAAGSFVYFTTGDGVAKAPLDGSGPKPGALDAGGSTGATLVAPGLKSAHGIVADATNVFVAVEGAGGATDGSIVKIGQTIAAPTPIASSRNRPRAIVIDGADLFFTEFGAVAGTGAITHVGKDGSGLSALATSVDRPSSLAVDATHVYFTTPSGVSRVARTGGADAGALQIAAISGAKGIAVDASAIYVTDDAHVLRLDKDGGGRTVIATTKVPVALLLDGTNLYVSEFDRIKKASTSGACPSCTQLLALGELSGFLDDVSSLAVAGDYLVYASPFGTESARSPSSK